MSIFGLNKYLVPVIWLLMITPSLVATRDRVLCLWNPSSMLGWPVIPLWGLNWALLSSPAQPVKFLLAVAAATAWLLCIHISKTS